MHALPVNTEPEWTEPSDADFSVPDVPVEYPELVRLSRIVLAGLALAVGAALRPSGRKLKK